MALPDIYYFNPTCELAVANGSFSYQPPARLKLLENDLSILPFVLSKSNDLVITDIQPSNMFIDGLEQAGFTLPEFHSLSHIETFPKHSFQSVRPWGWSPAAHFMLKELKDKCSEEFKQSSVFEWNDDRKILYERSTSLSLLRRILHDNTENWLIDNGLIPRVLTNIDEISTYLRQLSAAVLKAPLSSSGRGVQFVRKNELNMANKQWISGVLKHQKYIMAEPLLDKVLDLSFQFEIHSAERVDYLGFTIFDTNSNGQYIGTWINPDIGRLMPKEDMIEINEKINIAAQIVKEALQGSVYANLHRGYIGVDAMFFRHNNQLMMQPCIEVNCRTNMGVLALFLQKRTHPNSSGKFELFYGEGGKFREFILEKGKESRPIYRDTTLLSGVLPLSEPNLDSRYGAYIFLGADK